jgi:hypothetical protein
VAGTVLGTGTAALLGSDLTDPENDGNGDTGDNYNAEFNASSKAEFADDSETVETAFNVFRNSVDKGRSSKWCCDSAPQWVSAGNFGFLGKKYVLTHFTITSGNDSPRREADIWSIEGSNDPSNPNCWTPIFEYNKTGISPWGGTPNQVLLFTSPDAPQSVPPSFSGCTAYQYFRYSVTSTIATSQEDFPDSGHQLNELEFFGNEEGVQ